MTSRHVCNEYSSKGLKKSSRFEDFDAALLTNTSIRPRSLITSETIFRTDSGKAISQPKLDTLQPDSLAIVVAVNFAAVSFISTTATFAPAIASALQKT